MYTRTPKLQAVYEKEMAKLPPGYCPFCATDIKHRVMIDDDVCFATINRFPYAGSRYQFMVIPYRHVAGIEDCNTKELSSMFSLTKTLINKSKYQGRMEIITRAKGSSDRTVPGHVHQHLIIWE